MARKSKGIWSSDKDMGDLIYDVFLDCGHVNHEKMINANKKPVWMVGSAIPSNGATGRCDICGNVSTVESTKLIHGWGDY